MGFAMIKNIFRNHPRLANSVVYGFLYVSAEYSQQIIRKKLTNSQTKEEFIDYKALGRYLVVGSIINANYLYSWYGWLDRKYMGTQKKIIIKKVLLDQFIMTPPLYIIFYVSMSLLEGKENPLEECKKKFVQTFSISCVFWLPAQTINFLYLPFAGRIVYIGLCSFVWMNILCWIKAKDDLIWKMVELIESFDLKNYIAVIPSVCVGNVGQLASDLLISSLNLRKLGYIWHPQVLTFCGAEFFEHSNNVSTACELFFSDKLKLLVFQIRSALKKNIKNFLEDICSWLKEIKIKQVIILSGIFAHRRCDQQLVGEPLRYLFCPLTKTVESKKAVGRNWIELEINDSKSDMQATNLPSNLPGSGAAMKWYHKCVKENIPCSVLFEFCSDGNNTPDALKLINYLDEWLQLKKKQGINSWVIPLSWSLLFGTQPPAEIFN